MIIAVTGHRPNKLNNDFSLNGPLCQAIKNEFYTIFHKYQPRQVISGMALGTDMLWAIAALEKQIPVVAAIPFRGQEKAWPQKSQDLYWKILNHEDTTIHYVNKGGYTAWKMQSRNQWMVDNCDLLVAVFDGSTGGTYNCVQYAKKKKRNIKVINPQDILIGVK